MEEYKSSYVDNQVMTADPVMPHNIEAEKSVLGAVLISADAGETAVELLNSDDFYYSPHKILFSAIAALVNAGKPVDVITLMNAVDGLGKLNDVGGMEYLTDLSIFTPTAANIRYYIDIVKEYSTRRRLITTGNNMVNAALNGEYAVKDTINDAERRIFEIATNKSEDSLVHISLPLMATHRKIGELIKLKGKLSGITTGFRDLDRITSGLQRSDLMIVAARPAMGKTAFVLNLATNIALKGKASVAIFSLEMSSEQLLMRMVCAEAMVDMQRVKAGETTRDDLIKIADIMPSISNSKIYIDDTPGISPTQIRTKCRRIKAQQGLDVIIIDYLQLMQSDTRTENRVQVVAEMTRALKILARELDVTVILLSQLSRGPETRENHRPLMADLRESGAIEQDADIITMLYRPARYEDTEDNKAEVIIAKHRNGPTGTVNLAWVPQYTKFANLEREYDLNSDR